MEQKSKRADQLQFIRFCAFLLIFLWHANNFAFAFLPGANGAANGTEFFVLLSGFVSGYSSYNQDISCTLKGIMVYMWKKLKKVYPLYFITTVFTISYSAIPSLVANHLFEGLKSHIIQLVKSLLLVQSWFPTNYFSYNGVGWFLSTIMFLYLLNIPMRACATRIKKMKKAEFVFGIVFVVSFILTFMYCYLMRNTNMEYTEYVLPISRMGEYVCGMSLGYFVVSVRNRICDSITITILFTFFELGSLVLWIYGMYMPVVEWQNRIVHWMIPNCILISVFGMGKGVVSKLFSIKPLRYLGDISFECFLLHQIILFLFTSFSGVVGISKLGNLFSIVFCLMITVLCAALISDSKMNLNKKYMLS